LSDSSGAQRFLAVIDSLSPQDSLDVLSFVPSFFDRHLFVSSSGGQVGSPANHFFQARALFFALPDPLSISVGEPTTA